MANNLKNKMNIIFVCTGNIFRSVSAEYCLKKYLEKLDINGINVSSAGIDARPQPMPRSILYQLSKLEIDASAHQQKKLEERHLSEADLIVSMGISHRRYILEKFNYDSRLFNEICHGKMTSVLDINEAVPEWESNIKESREHMTWTIKYIYDSMSGFLENYGNFLTSRSRKI